MSDKTIKFSACSCSVILGKFNINEICLDCPAVWRMFAGGHTVGVFQLEKKLGQDWSQKLRPDSTEELAALISLIRPGPLNADLSQNYVDIKFGRKKICYLHPSLKHILDSTYGQMVFQEQALKIATDIAGFNAIESDTLRKSIGKKLPELMAKLKNKFVDGCQTHSKIHKDIAEEIFGWIEKCQRYSFNKCLSGETVIRKASKGKNLTTDGYTIEHMYYIRNDIEYAKRYGHESLRRKWNILGNYGKGLSLCKDGRIRPNTIENIQPAGQRDVYKIVLENGNSITTTSNHKFPTPNGTKNLSQLNPGDYLYICGYYEESDFNKINKFSSKTRTYKNRKYKYAKCGFPYGNANPAYTNGSYISFQDYRNNTKDECEQCHKTKCRIEIAHLNGDRSDSSYTNLRKFCVSCHKKYDYLNNNRTKRGEKGYPLNTMMIKSISKSGMSKVWDVTMAGPDHTLVVNGDIITCNSHAISYAMIAYQTCWLKAHFPYEFFTSYLTYSPYKSDPKEEVYQLVQEARLFNINIFPPDIRRGNIDFEMTNIPEKGIAFGLAHVRGVGSAAIVKIISTINNELKEKRLDTWCNFLSAVPDFHRNVGIALIKSGACDCFGLERSQMIHELEIILGATTRDENGKKIEIKGLTDKEKGYFFKELNAGILNTREVLLQMSQPPGDKRKTLKQMTKAELIDTAVGYLDQAGSAFDGIIDGDSKFIYTSNNEKEIWLNDIKQRTKKAIESLILQNGYKDIVFKPPCSSDSRRRKMKEKASLLEIEYKDTNSAKAIAEKYFLGIALSCSKADDADSSLATHTCLEIAKATNNESIVVCGIIDSVKHTKTKRGKNPGQPMCFLTISDSTYSIDHAVVFPDMFGRLKGLCKEDIVCLIYGDKKNGSLIIRDIQKLM